MFSNRLISVAHKCAHNDGDNTGTLKKENSKKLRREKRRKTEVREGDRCNKSFKMYSSMDLGKALTTHDNNKGKETDQKFILWNNAVLIAAQDAL